MNTMTDIGEAIVAGVIHVSEAPGDLADQLTVSYRRSTAEAGSVGE